MNPRRRLHHCRFGSSPGFSEALLATLAVATLLLSSCSFSQKPAPVPEKLEREFVETSSRIVALDFSGDSKYLAVLCENGDVVRWDVLRGETIGQTHLTGETRQVFDFGTRSRFAVAVTKIVEVSVLDEGPNTVSNSGTAPEANSAPGPGNHDRVPDDVDSDEFDETDETDETDVTDVTDESNESDGVAPEQEPSDKEGTGTDSDVAGPEKISDVIPPPDDVQISIGSADSGPSFKDRTRIEIREWLEIWDTDKGVETSISLPVDTASFILFDQPAQRIAASDDEGYITVWNANDGSTLKRLKLEPPDEDSRLVPGASFGVIYYLSTGDLRVRSLDAEGMDTVLSFPRDASVDVALSADSRTLASLNNDGAIEVRKLPDGEIQTQIADFEGTPKSLALSSDGSVLAVHAGGTTIDLWDTRNAELLDQHESTLWVEGGVSFSPDGNVIAWTEENQRNVRFWSPVEGVVVWKSAGPELIENARAVCPDLASIIRFRHAQAPFAQAVVHLEKGELDEARRSFAIAQRIFPTYPGLAAAAADAEERHQAQLSAEILKAELADFEAEGKYVEALGALDGFLRVFERYDKHGFGNRAKTLRSMLEHFQLAEAQRESQREIDAVVEFEQAVAIVPELSDFHPDYAELRDGLVAQLSSDAALSFESHDHKKALELYEGLKRLRPLAAAELFRCGESTLKLDQPKRAQEAFESISDAAPEYAMARRRLARIARDNGELELARAELERARAATPSQIPIETDYAEVCELLGELDVAIAAWERIGELDSSSTKSFERIGSIEEGRKRWKEAGENYRAAIRRSNKPRPKLLMKVAEAYGHTGDNDLVLQAYVDLLEVVRGGMEVTWLGDRPMKRIHKWIGDLGYVHHRGEWILRDQFLAEQGWMRRLGTWIRPEEVRLREVISRTKRLVTTDFRTLGEERYRTLAAENTIVKGMNRREVIEAWGFFEDQNVVEFDNGETIYEQLLFEKGRKVYLRNGFVCFWTE